MTQLKNFTLYIDKASEFRRTTIAEGRDLVQEVINIFFDSYPEVEEIKFRIDLPQWNTYRDNPIISNWTLKLDNAIVKIQDDKDGDYSSIVGTLNSIFRELGIGLVSKYGQGEVIICNNNLKTL